MNLHTAYVPPSVPTARRRYALSAKFLSSVKLPGRMVRVKVQEIRPPEKDELTKWNANWFCKLVENVGVDTV